ncbi:inner membrane-spanning protein YciB [Pleionea sediminis]|uniref:inner membrane-spanning protein YciB n=1 Tax=Pleionea sediminis TaxID=2569479 RepID=UPI00118568B8|nr:inner membrane-spanning protein YciB [Pleionea sediminis]
MKLFLDFFPVLAFFISAKVWDIYIATAVLILGSFIQTVGHWLIKKKFEKLHLVTFFASLILGSMTLFFRDDSFIKWKVSVVYWIFSGTIFVFLLRKKIAIKALFEGLMKIDMGLKDTLWHKINMAWAISLLALGFLNLWIAYSFSLDAWVNFKVWGTMIIQLIMMLVTFFIIFKNMPEENRRALEQEEPPKEND